jgi:hypothetical protein
VCGEGVGGVGEVLTIPAGSRTGKGRAVLDARALTMLCCQAICLVQNVWGDPPHAILARLEPNDHQGSPAHSV